MAAKKQTTGKTSGRVKKTAETEPKAAAKPPKPKQKATQQNVDAPLSDTNNKQLKTVGSDENNMEDRIIQAYKELLLSGENSITVYGICKKAEIDEKDFYAVFSNVAEIPQRVWARLADVIKLQLSQSAAYEKYGAREKVLAYFFTFFEMALPARSFIEKTAQEEGVLKLYRSAFLEFMQEIVQDGVASSEMLERFSLSNKYPNLLWELHKSLLNFWLKDTSEQFIETEKAIEIYSKVPLELMGHTVLDSLLETARYNWDRFRAHNFKSR